MDLSSGDLDTKRIQKQYDMCNAKKFFERCHEHSHNLFAVLEFLNLQDIYRIEVGKFIYYYYNGNPPCSLSHLFQFTITFTTTISDNLKIYVLLTVLLQFYQIAYLLIDRVTWTTFHMLSCLVWSQYLARRSMVVKSPRHLVRGQS